MREMRRSRLEPLTPTDVVVVNDPLTSTSLELTVIGVLSRKGQSPMGQDQDDVVLVPAEGAAFLLHDPDDGEGVVAEAEQDGEVLEVGVDDATGHRAAAEDGVVGHAEAGAFADVSASVVLVRAESAEAGQCLRADPGRLLRLCGPMGRYSSIRRRRSSLP